MVEKIQSVERRGPAPTFGWMRRPELDSPKYDCWEAPDGVLYGYYDKGTVPYLLEGQIIENEPKPKPTSRKTVSKKRS